MSCPTKVQSALKKLDWIDVATMGASRVTTQVWFKTKSGQKYDEDALKGAITKAGSNYAFAGLVKGPAVAVDKPADKSSDPANEQKPVSGS